MNEEKLDIEWVNEVLQLLNKGVFNKAEKGDVKAYRVGDNLVRVDIKTK